MRQSYTAFKFGTQVFHEDISNYKLLNATLSDDFYADCIRGSRSILEEKIPGRDIPYFYEVDDEPLEFEVTFAFAESMTKAQIKTIVRKLVSVKTYQELTFGKYVSSTYTAETPIYKVMFVGETDINYVSTGFDGSNNELFIAYITLTARVDRPYGYNDITATATNTDILTVVNTGDIEFYPSLVITNTNTGSTIQTDKYIRVKNNTNQSSITFSSLASGEVVTVNANLQTITSISGSTPIYPRWQRDNFYLSIGSNSLQFSYSTDAESWTDYNMTVVVSGEAPVYIYEAE